MSLGPMPAFSYACFDARRVSVLTSGRVAGAIGPRIRREHRSRDLCALASAGELFQLVLADRESQPPRRHPSGNTYKECWDTRPCAHSSRLRARLHCDTARTDSWSHACATSPRFSRSARAWCRTCACARYPPVRTRQASGRSRACPRSSTRDRRRRRRRAIPACPSARRQPPSRCHTSRMRPTCTPRETRSSRWRMRSRR